MTEDRYNNWVVKEGIEYDEERYDRDNPNNCQKCGAELSGGGGRSGYVARCLECGVTVMII